jgi:hypothetical protein
MTGPLYEFRVHFIKGTRVGTRSLRTIHVQASNKDNARTLAILQFPEHHNLGFHIDRITQVRPVES